MAENQDVENPQEPIPAQEAEESEAQAAAQAPGEKVKAPDLKKPSGFNRISYSLFNRETRGGRFFRTALRWLALIVGLFALGVLAAYVLLYRPVDQKLQDAHVKATESAVDLQRAQFNLDKTQTDLKDAQTRADDAQNQLSTELTRVQVLRAKNFLTQTMVALQSKDKAGAQKTLASAESIIQQTKPRLDKLDANEFSTLQALFTLVKNDTERDLNLAIQDLNRLQDELNRLDHSLP